jgi:hypothetical protein
MWLSASKVLYGSSRWTNSMYSAVVIGNLLRGALERSSRIVETSIS